MRGSLDDVPLNFWYVVCHVVDTSVLLVALVIPREQVSRIVLLSDPTGKLPIPVVSIHSINDPQVPVEQQAAYRDTVAAAGSADRLLFSIKEAFYKAWFQLSGEFLACRELQVSIDPSTSSFGAAVLKSGVADYFRDRQFTGRYALDARLICSAVALPRD